MRVKCNYMKEYNRQTKRWEDPIDKGGSLKTRKTCRGGREHDFQLSLPKYISENVDLPLSSIEEYYKSEERISEFMRKESELLHSLGIKKNWGFRGARIYKYYKCTVCGKQEYDL